MYPALPGYPTRIVPVPLGIWRSVTKVTQVLGRARKELPNVLGPVRELYPDRTRTLGYLVKRYPRYQSFG